MKQIEEMELAEGVGAVERISEQDVSRKERESVNDEVSVSMVSMISRLHTTVQAKLTRARGVEQNYKGGTYVGIRGGGSPPGRTGGGAAPRPGTFGAGRPGGGGAPRLGLEAGGGIGRLLETFDGGSGLLAIELLAIGVGDGAELRNCQSSLIGGGAGW